MKIFGRLRYFKAQRVRCFPEENSFPTLPQLNKLKMFEPKEWFKCTDDGNMLGTILLDLRNRLTSQPRNIIKKLNSYQFSPQTPQWFESYLSIQPMRTCKRGPFKPLANIMWSSSGINCRTTSIYSLY